MASDEFVQVVEKMTREGPVRFTLTYDPRNGDLLSIRTDSRNSLLKGACGVASAYIKDLGTEKVGTAFLSADQDRYGAIHALGEVIKNYEPTIPESEAYLEFVPGLL